MSASKRPADGAMTLAEIKEFAGFSAATQRYVRRSLDVGLEREDALSRWSRDTVEAASIRAQARVYDRLDEIRTIVPDDSGLDSVEIFMAPLITVSAFDLGQGRLTSFSAYRFLYERLIGAEVRPWLPGAFCAAAALPHLHPDLRRSCCSRSARLRRPRPAGRTASPASSRPGSKRSTPRRPCRTELPQAGLTRFSDRPATRRAAARRDAGDRDARHCNRATRWSRTARTRHREPHAGTPLSRHPPANRARP